MVVSFVSFVCVATKCSHESHEIHETRERRSLTSRAAPPNRKEQSTLAAERRRPRELRDPALHAPIVLGRGEQLRRIIVENGAREASKIVNAGLVKPSHDFTDRVRPFFGMLVLIAQPRLAAGGLRPASSSPTGAVPVAGPARWVPPTSERPMLLMLLMFRTSNAPGASAEHGRRRRNRDDRTTQQQPLLDAK